MGELRLETCANDAPPARRRSDRPGDGNAARDRLVSMLLLAGLLHGLLILGVTFGPAPERGSGPAGLEVLLVSDELPEAQRNDKATYLSQRSQLGSGNTQERMAARVPGFAPGGGPPPLPEPRNTSTATPEDEILATNAPRARVSFQGAPAAPDDISPEVMADMPLLLGAGEGAQQQQSLDAAAELALRGVKRDELYVTADTRASHLAPYLDGWRRRVERVGTLNYPSAAQRQHLEGNPVIEVTIRSDGQLESASIRHSSGHPEIDAAALQILRLASPFDPFPPDLANEYKVLRFAYEWQFVGGHLAQGSLSVP